MEEKMTYLNTYGKITDHNAIIPPIPEDVDFNSPGWWNDDFIVIKEGPQELTLRSIVFEKNYPILKVKPQGFRAIGSPKFLLDEKILVSKNGKLGHIYSIIYHSKRDRFRYMVDYGDRKSTCWYFDEDLEKVEPAQ
jgi:hypothetical protein